MTKKILIATLLAAALFGAVSVHAQTSPNTMKTVELTNPLAGASAQGGVPQIVGTIIKGALGVVGSLVLLMVVWGGFTWLTAAGNPEKIKSGSNTMIWAVIGLIVVFSSYFALDFVLKAIAGTI